MSATTLAILALGILSGASVFFALLAMLVANINKRHLHEVERETLRIRNHIGTIIDLLGSQQELWGVHMDIHKTEAALDNIRPIRKRPPEGAN